MDENDGGAMGLWTMGCRLEEDGMQTREQGCRLGAKEQTEGFGVKAGDLYQLHIHNHTH